MCFNDIQNGNSALERRIIEYAAYRILLVEATDAVRALPLKPFATQFQVNPYLTGLYLDG